MTASDPSSSNPAPQGEQLIIRLPGQAADWKEISLWAGVLALLVLVTFFPATSGTLLPRDVNWVRFTPSPGSVSAVWENKAPMPAYQPMAFTAYWLENRLQGKSTNGQPVLTGFHLGSLVLHAAAVILFWLILRDLRVPGSWLAAALFAVHPVNTEALSWISSQGVVLAAAMGFGAVYCWMHFARFRDRDIAERFEGGAGVDPAITWSLYAGGFLLAALSVLSNPVGVIFPAMAMFALGWRRKLTSSDVLLLVIPAIISLILWAIEASNSSFDMTTMQIVGTIGEGFWNCLRDVLVPVRLTTFHPGGGATGTLNVIIFSMFWPMIGLLVVLGWKRSPGISVGGVGFMLAAIFGLNWFEPGRGGAVSDGSGYVAGAFLITLLVAGAAWLIPPTKQSMTTVLGAAVLLLLVLLITARVRTGAFETPVKFWQDVVDKNPAGREATFPQGKLAEELRLKALTEYAEDSPDAAKFDMGKAIEHAATAVQLEPHNGQAERTWANALVSMGEVNEGLKHYAAAMRIFPHDPELRLEGARALMMKGSHADYLQAIQQVDYAIADAPSAIELHRLLGQAYAGAGDYKRAVLEENIVLAANPQDVDARQILAESLANQGDLTKALAEYQELGDNFHVKRPENYVEMAKIFDKLGKYVEETYALKIAASLDPDSNKYKAGYDAAMKKAALQASTQPTTRATTLPITTAATTTSTK